MRQSFSENHPSSRVSPHIVPHWSPQTERNIKIKTRPCFITANSPGFPASPPPPFGPLGTLPSPLIAPGKANHKGRLWAAMLATGLS